MSAVGRGRAINDVGKGHAPEALYYRVPAPGNKPAGSRAEYATKPVADASGPRLSYRNKAHRSGLDREGFGMRSHFFTVLLTAFLFAAPMNAANSTEPEAMTISTSSPGSVFYPYGHGLASMLTKYVGVTFTDQPSQASAQNVLLLEQRKATLGFVTMGVALQAWNGTGWAKGTQYRSMRALFPMYDTPFQFAAPQRLHLTSLGGFAGKRIGAGPKASTAGTYFPEVFKIFDIS